MKAIILKASVFLLCLQLSTAGLSAQRDQLIPGITIEDRVKVEQLETEGQDPEQTEILIRRKGFWLTSDGADKAAELNNRAIDLLYENSGRENDNRAFQLLKSITAEAPDFMPAYYNLALLSIMQNRIQEARNASLRCIELLPEYWRCDYLYGYALLYSNRFEAAVQAFRDAYRKNNSFTAARIAIGDVYRIRGRYQKALRIYNRYSEHIAAGQSARIGAGITELGRSDAEAAVDIFRRISIFREYDRRMHFYYATALFYLKRYRAALAQYKMALNFRRVMQFNRIPLTLIERRIRQIESELNKAESVTGN